MKPKQYAYETCCVESDAESIINMTEQAREVTYRTVLKHCRGLLQWASHRLYARNRRCGLTLARDCCVGFYKSRYRGRPCYYVDHSRIEYIWTKR